MSGYRILLVDDDPFFLQFHGDFLRTRAFEVTTAAGGERALELFTPGRFELVVVDLVMPGLSGLELIERIRSIHPAQDILVVTGSDDIRTAVRAMRLGVYDYLVKPIEREQLVMIIDRLQERATLYDEHARLLHENILYAEVQQIFQRALRVLQSLDLETVCERLLEAVAEVCGAQGAVLWLARDDASELTMQGFRGLVEPAELQMAWNPEHTAVGKELVRGLPVMVGRDLTTLSRQESPAESMLCPLAKDGRLVGLLHVVHKLSGGFDGRDAAYAKIVADCGATAVLHARRFRQLERVGLRDPTTTAYNMTYFADYLGRELHKARRYGRSFAVVQLSVDNLPSLKQGLRPEVLREALRRVVLAVSSVLREIDVLARVTDEEMYLLLPETDFLGALAFARTAKDAIARSPFLAEIDREHPIAVSFGPAAFPRDGDDVDQLFAACGRRLDEARRSLFRRLHLEDVDFWAAVELLVGPPDLYNKGALDSQRALVVTEDPRGLGRHHQFPTGFTSLVHEEVLAEVQRQGLLGGWLFLGGAFSSKDLGLVDRLRSLERTNVRPYLLGRELPQRLRDTAAVTCVSVESDLFDRHDVVLLLSEHASYGLLGRRRPDGRIFGFHTADWTLVEGLIGKLQDTYHLQRGSA
ncbi:MAG: response regulator [Deltaproteobacteria bacterium]|nr:response regulator [Deltaproteobacteria bacterium]